MPDISPTEPDDLKKQREEGKVAGPAFDLPIDDSALSSIIDKRIEASETYFKKTLNLEDRMKQNENFWLGKQFDESQLYDYQMPYKDNIIWQDEETRLGILSSRIPDIVVFPTNQTKEKINAAKTLEKGLNIKIKDDVVRRLVKDGLRYHDLYFYAAIKPRWDKDRNDYTYDLIRPQKLIMDHTATIPQDGFTADNMEFIGEWMEAPVAQVIHDFPSKKDIILEGNGMTFGTTRQLNSKMRYQEIWFTFYGRDSILYEGICWKFKKEILGKQKNPYWDWEGYEKNKEGKPLTIFRNHFDRPRKPYIFFVYQNLGKCPIDDTTAIEQAIPLQKIVNKRGRQITEIADRTVPKLAAISDAITKEDFRRITNDPDEHVYLTGNVQDIRAALMTIQAEAPAPILYQDLAANRTQIDAKFATHSTTRGELVPRESGISKQITREGDISKQDDESKIVIERVIYEMANWAVQLMKLFYEKEHFVRHVGKDGEGVYVALKRDLIDDGISVNVFSSSVDRDQRRFDAQTSAARRLIDPLSYWEDMDTPNPRERTRRLITFLSGQFGQYAQMTDLAPEEQRDRGKEEAEVDIDRLEKGQDFEVPVPTASYLQHMIEFTSTDEYKKLSDSVKKRFKEFIPKLKEKLQKEMEKMNVPPQVAGQMPTGIQPIEGTIPSVQTTAHLQL